MKSSVPANALPPIELYYAMVRSIAHKFWVQLPTDHKNWIDLDDVMQEGVVKFCMLAAKFDPARKVKFSTLLYTALTNHYCSFLAKYRVPMRRGISVPIEDLQITAGHEQADIQAAEGRINEVLDHGSPELVDFLTSSFFGTVFEDPTPGVVAELQEVCRKVGATADDFRALKAIPGLVLRVKAYRVETARVALAETRVNALLEVASPRLVEYLRKRYFSGGLSRYRPIPPKVRAEFDSLCQTVGTAVEDFIVLRTFALIR